jgi:hypothetical protein
MSAIGHDSSRPVLAEAVRELTAVRTHCRVWVRKWLDPIHSLSVPNGCSAACRRTRMMSGCRSIQSAALRPLLRVVEQCLRAHSPGSGPAARLGAVAFIGRFGSSLNARHRPAAPEAAATARPPRRAHPAAARPPPPLLGMLARMAAAGKFPLRPGTAGAGPVAGIEAIRPSGRCMAHSGHRGANHPYPTVGGAESGRSTDAMSRPPIATKRIAASRLRLPPARSGARSTSA